MSRDFVGQTDLGPLFARPVFKGDDYTPALDYSRLSSGLALVIAIMADGKWRTKADIAVEADDDWGKYIEKESIGRYLRYAKEKRNGGFTLERRRKGLETNGLYEYRLKK